MVHVTAFKKVITEDGDTYVRLILKGDVELVKSKTTGNFYATTRSCSVSSTFSEEEAQLMIGKVIPGKIVKQYVSEPYIITLDNGETVELNYRWTYSDDEAVDILFEKSAENGSIDSKQLELEAA